MFGMKLRSWMEARIVRARKKRSGVGGGKEEGKGAVVSFPSAPKGPGGGDHSSSETPYLSRRDDMEGDEGRNRPAGRTAEEDPRPASDYSANLSSPESAYSTGYSTDGTSPGASFPPEYYINLRTGTHYFQQQQNQQLHQTQQHHHTPPPPPPPPHGRRRPQSPNRRGQESSPPPPTPPPRRPQVVQPPPPPHRRPLPGHLALSPRHSAREQTPLPPHPARLHHHAAAAAAPPAAPYSPSCLRVKGRCGPPSAAEVRFAGMAAEASAARVAEEFTRRHRRTESAHEKGIPRPEVLTSTPIERRRKISNQGIIPPLAAVPPATLLPQTSVTDSPRQRTRIRTNPWTSTKGAVQSPGPLCGLPPFTAASEGRDIPIPPLRERCPSPPPPAPSGGGGVVSGTPRGFGSPFALPRKRVSPALSARRVPLRVGRRSTDTSSSSSSSSRSSHCGTEEDEEDATLNEMGKFDESYVYEKETDILSDSDPTDCGDEDDLQEDDETCYFRRDEDDEMDFIDNGSVELDARCRTPVNTGHCTYVRDSMRVRRTVDEGPGRDMLCCSSEAARRRATAPRPPSQRRRPSRRSTGGSRMRRERKPPQGGEGAEDSVAEREEERPPEAPKTNGVAPQPSNLPQERLPDFAFSPEGEFAKADREADRKYRELIRQAERILVRMQGSRSLEEDEKPAASQSPVPVPEEDSAAEEGREDDVVGVGRSSRSFNHHHPHRNQGRWRTLGLECAEITLPLTPHDGTGVGRHAGVHPPTPTAAEARLLTFRSVGVGREPEEGRPHCPQSEPLKRKVYTCAALQRIRRTLMGEGVEGRYEEEVEGRGLLENGIDDEFCSGINRNETMSPSRISHCRGRRASSWHKTNQIIIDEQGNEQFGHRMVLLQRHILLQTIEGLKRSLEDQSATLHDVYKSSQTTLIET
ncbi:protein PRRC2A [Ischnura elegans]|uniref:protein PRRC2A n=1 Tax=Ischnura elegans TaxID=197161 RepID=UPI001ED8BF87|nr:protein PRRC2A [Ischnura elegans]